MRAKQRLPIVGILMFPWASAGPFTFVEELLEILEPLSQGVVVFTGGTDRIVRKDSAKLVDCGFRLHYVEMSRMAILSRLSWVLKSLMFQVSASLFFVMHSRKIDVAFFLAHPHESLPLLTARICGIRTVEIVTRGESIRGGGLTTLARISERLSYSLCNSIAIESKSLITSIDRERHRSKVVGIASRYVDLATFSPRIPFNQRKRNIAYVGRFRAEKGVMEFVSAIPGMVSKCGANISLVGAGDLDSDIATRLATLDGEVRNHVTHHGWVSKGRLAEILGQTAILVHPSESEGLPTTILQAMASGVIVLASRVGGVPDVVIDGTTGFLLSDRTSGTIESSACAILNMPTLGVISEASRRLVSTEFTIEAARARYAAILAESLKDAHV